MSKVRSIMGKDATEAGYAYKRIANEIEEQIRSGALPPGTQLPTVRAYAEELGCHYHTIRRAFQELSDKGLIERKQGSGSYVKDIRNLQTRHAIPTLQKVGVIFEPGKCGFYLDRLLRFLHFEADRQQLQMTLRTAARLDASTAKIVNDLACEGCSSIVIPWVSPGTKPSALVSLVQNSPIPIVTPLDLPGIERNSYQPEPHRAMVAEELVSLVGGYFRGLRYENIGLVGPSYTTAVPTFFQNIMMAYSSYVLENRLPNHACPVQVKDPRAFEPLIERWRPHFGNLAVFCYHDRIAVDLQNTLLKNGVRVPEDVAILGHNNDPLTASAMPGISSFTCAHRSIAKAMLDHVQNLVAGRSRQPHIEEPRELVVRESCGGFARLGNKLDNLASSLGIKLFKGKKHVVHHDFG